MDRQGLSIPLYTCSYIRIYTHIYIYTHTYISIYAQAHIGIWGVSNTALNFCWLCGPKANLCHVIGGSANIYIFIRELKQEKTSECRKAGEGMMLSEEAGEL